MQLGQCRTTAGTVVRTGDNASSVDASALAVSPTPAPQSRKSARESSIRSCSLVYGACIAASLAESSRKVLKSSYSVAIQSLRFTTKEPTALYTVEHVSSQRERFCGEAPAALPSPPPASCGEASAALPSPHPPSAAPAALPSPPRRRHAARPRLPLGPPRRHHAALLRVMGAEDFRYVEATVLQHSLHRLAHKYHGTGVFHPTS
jgi:hypothetical protein